MHWRIYTPWFPKIDKTHQFYSSEKVRKMRLLPNLSGSFSFSLSLQHSQQHTSFSITCKQQAFLFILTYFRSGREKQTCGTIIETRPWRRRERGRQLLTLSWVACFCLPLKETRCGKKEKEKEERDSFYFLYFFYKSHLQKLGPGRRAAVVHKRAASCRRVEAQWVLAWLKSGNGSLYRTLTWEWDV